jgi:short-subunit dehydrogenase
MAHTPLPADNRVILVSGSNRGIGLAIAKRLYDEGYKLSLGARRPDSLSALIVSFVARKLGAQIAKELVAEIQGRRSHFEFLTRSDGCGGRRCQYFCISSGVSFSPTHAQASYARTRMRRAQGPREDSACRSACPRDRFTVLAVIRYPVLHMIS